MARRPNQHAMGYAERLVVVEERLDGLAAEVVDIGQKLDRLLQLGIDRAQTFDAVKTSVDRLQIGFKGLKDDTEFIRTSMAFARLVRRLAMWGVPIIGFVLWVSERYDLIAKLFRRS